jgi:hypothetical protein
LSAQQPSSFPSSKPKPVLAQHPEWPKADPSDVATIEDTVRAFYSTLSVPAGGKVNRDRLYSLFVPDGRIAIGLSPQPGRPADLILETLDQLAASGDAYTATKGFFDHNVANHIQQFGVMAQVYSTYESRPHVEDKTPMARGIKSFELLHSGNRWYIVQVYWDSERPDNPLPERYLHNDSDGTVQQK